MRTITGKNRQPSGTAIPFPIFQAIHPAIPRAEAAGLQNGSSVLNSFDKVAFVIRIDIKGLKNFCPLPIFQEISFF